MERDIMNETEISILKEKIVALEIIIRGSSDKKRIDACKKKLKSIKEELKRGEKCQGTLKK